jgi:hypothetical protein
MDTLIILHLQCFSYQQRQGFLAKLEREILVEAGSMVKTDASNCSETHLDYIGILPNWDIGYFT